MYIDIHIKNVSVRILNLIVYDSYLNFNKSDPGERNEKWSKEIFTRTSYYHVFDLLLPYAYNIMMVLSIKKRFSLT